MSTRILGVVGSILVLGASRTARADEAAEGAAIAAASYEQAIVGDFGLGVVSSKGSDFEGAFTVEGALIKRLSVFEVGGRAELGSALLGNHRLGLGGLAGIGSHRSRIGVDLLAEGGFHTYGGVESDDTGFFDKTRGAGGTVPYVGLRLAVDVPFASASAPPSGHARGFVGVALSLRLEPWQTQDAYAFNEGHLFSENDRTSQVAHAAVGGATEVGLALRFGFDVAR